MERANCIVDKSLEQKSEKIKIPENKIVKNKIVKNVHIPSTPKSQIEVARKEDEYLDDEE